MNVVVVGTGEMGGALAMRIAVTTNHRLAVRGSRAGSDSAARLLVSLGERASEASDTDVAEADLVLLAVPWSSLADAAAMLARTSAKHVVSVVVPWTGDAAEPAIGRDDSAAEVLARALPNARIANAFTTVSATTLATLDAYDEAPTIFAASDDRAIKAALRELVEAMGFASLDAGPLYASRFTEAMGFLWYALAITGGAGEAIAFRAVLPRSEGPLA